MSLVTRCTSCGTMFKVVADQLKISQGWVRCGQCATVFDAQANLVPTPEHVAQPAPPSQAHAAAEFPANVSAAAPTIQAQATKAELPKHVESDISSDIQSFRNSKWEGSGMLGEYAGSRAHTTSPLTSPLTSPNAPLRAAQSDTPPASKPWQDASNFGDEPSSSMLRSDDPTTLSPISIAPDSSTSNSIALNSALPDSELAQPIVSQASGRDAPIATPDFVVQAQRSQRWRSPWVRFGLSLVGLILLAILAVQIALHDKDQIAAQWPQAKPWLDQLCQLAGCKIQALRRIEAIAVDSSSFNRINKNNVQLEAVTQSYRLAVTLKNTGSLPVALPYVELSLQDAQDQTILRRVLSPADLGSSLNALAPAQEMPGNVTLQIDTAQLAGSRIAGYRVLAFYP